MNDAIQQQLHQAWVAGDRAALGEACDGLSREWRPRIRRFLSNPSVEEVEDLLQQAIMDLAIAHGDAPPRALAGPDVTRSKAWRSRVLQNHLCSQGRHQGRRRHAEQGLRLGLSPMAEKRQWARRKEERERGAAMLNELRPHQLHDPLGQADAPPTQGDEGRTEAQLELESMRRSLYPHLATLAIRRRVMAALALRFDPSPFAEELAQTLKEPAENILGRMADAAAAAGSDDPPTEAAVRVVWPEQELHKATEAARKTQERGLKDLQERIGRSA